MMIKICRPKKHYPEADYGWSVFGELERVDYWGVPIEVLESNKVSFNYKFIEEKPSGEEQSQFIHVNAEQKSTNKAGFEKNISIVFNTTAYLCNDDGKTIERLN